MLSEIGRLSTRLRAAGARRGRDRAAATSAPPRRAAPTTRPRRSRRESSSTTARRSRSSRTTGSLGNLVGIHGDRPENEVFAEIQESSRAARGSRDHPQVPGRDRDDGERRPRRRRHARADRRAPPAGRHDRRSSTSSPTSTSARGRHLVVPRLPRLSRRRSARRRTTWSCTASPTARRSPTGDILSVDVGVILDGFVADSAYTFPVGEISSDAGAAARGLPGRARGGHRAVPAGNRLSDVSHAIQNATEEAGFSVVRSLVGHGIGRSMHEDPQIPNYGPPGRGPGARSRG